MVQRLALRAACVLLFSAFAILAYAQPPSLAEVARQESARRAAIAETSKVYTNDDLHRGSRLTTGGSVLEAETDPEHIAEEPDTTTDDLQPELARDARRDETYWRDRIASARESERRAELMVAALQNRIEALWELQVTQVEIERLDDEIRNIQEEARRASIPPGWLR